eukprot:SAG11_NODE_45897_length_140_cov_393.853659_1_plen_31_part_10
MLNKNNIVAWAKMSKVVFAAAALAPVLIDRR